MAGIRALSSLAERGRGTARRAVEGGTAAGCLAVTALFLFCPPLVLRSPQKRASRRTLQPARPTPRDWTIPSTNSGQALRDAMLRIAPQYEDTGGGADRPGALLCSLSACSSFLLSSFRFLQFRKQVKGWRRFDRETLGRPLRRPVGREPECAKKGILKSTGIPGPWARDQGPPRK
jgi:hypothetical protein